MAQGEALGIPDLLPLDGVRVVELADWRGEFLGRLLANLGADVIKVEPPGGAPSRRLGPFQNDTDDPERSIFWWHFNVGKRGLTLDISNDDGRALLDRLLGTADIFVETLGVDGLADAGLGGWEAVHERWPGLVVISITDFGLDGPWASYQGGEIVSLALSGQMMTAGYPPVEEGVYDTPPMAPGMHQPVNITGCLGVMDALAALAQRDTTGLGQRVDLSVHAAVNNGSENHVSWYIGAGVIAKRKPQFPTAPAKDGTLVQVMPGLFGQEWGKLAALLDRHGMARDLTDPKYEDRAYRAVPENQAHINEVVSAFIATRNADDLFHAAQESGVVWAPIRLPHENVGDPHMTERGGFTEVDHPEAGVRVTMPHTPWVSDQLGWRTGPRAPLLGEHTEAILAELGETDAGIGALRRRGAV